MLAVLATIHKSGLNKHPGYQFPPYLYSCIFLKTTLEDVAIMAEETKNK